MNHHHLQSTNLLPSNHMKFQIKLSKKSWRMNLFLKSMMDKITQLTKGKEKIQSLLKGVEPPTKAMCLTIRLKSSSHSAKRLLEPSSHSLRQESCLVRELTLLKSAIRAKLMKLSSADSALTTHTFFSVIHSYLHCLKLWVTGWSIDYTYYKTAGIIRRLVATERTDLT